MAPLAWLLVAVAKGSALLIGLWLLGRLTASASRRHALLVTGVLAHAAILILIPLVRAVAFPVPLPIPAALAGSVSVEARWVARSGESHSAPVTADPEAGVRPEPVGPSFTAAAPPLRAEEAALWIWALGAAFLLARLGMSHGRARRWAAGGRPVRNRRWRSDLRLMRERLDVAVPVLLVSRSDVVVPVCFEGAARTIVLPPNARGWSQRRRRVVLLHELAHLKRRDSLTQTLCSAVCCALWPNPLLWTANRALRAEAEHACDDAVVASGLRPSEYILELVAIARAAGSPRPAPAIAMAASPHLGRRTSRLLAPRDHGLPMNRATILRLVLGSTVAAAALAAARPLPAVVDEIATQRLTIAPVVLPSCPYQGGALRNRRLPSETGTALWEVYWEGADCQVRLEGRAPGPPRAASWTRLGDRGAIWLEPRAPGASVTLAISRAGADALVSQVREANGRLRQEVTINGMTSAVSDPAEQWLSALALDVDRLTGFAVELRLPELLARGGVAAVFEEVAATRGDHAAGIYLSALVSARTLSEPELEQLLRLAAGRVTNEAVLVDLLRQVAANHAVDAGPFRDAFAAAAVRLRTRAGRETIAALLTG